MTMVGEIIHYHTETGVGLFRVMYPDGDVEDLPVSVAISSLLTMPVPRAPIRRVASQKRRRGASGCDEHAAAVHMG